METTPICREPSRTFVAYLNDPAAVGGAAPLLRQKRSVERAAASLGGRIVRWGVDSGRRRPDQRCGDAVLRLIAGLGRGDTLLVEDLALLGADPEAVEVVVGTLGMLGVAVVAARSIGRSGASRWETVEPVMPVLAEAVRSVRLRAVAASPARTGLEPAA